MADKETFNKAVEIIGTDPNVIQLEVQGPSGQQEPLQTWQQLETVLAQISKSGQLQLGDINTGPAVALLEADAGPSQTSTLKRAWQSRGQVTGQLTELVAWIVHQLELEADNQSPGPHTAMQVQLTHKNTNNPANTQLQVGDFEAINETDTAVEQLTGVRAAITNNDNAGDINVAAAVEVAPLNNNGTINTLYGVRVRAPEVEGTIGQGKYAVYTEPDAGAVHIGDFLEIDEVSAPAAPDAESPSGDKRARIYLKDDGKLYAKNSDNVEYDLTGGGGGTTVDYILLHDEKASGTAGGTFTAGSWIRRAVTEIVDGAGIVEVTDGLPFGEIPYQITLQPGTYRCRITCPAFRVEKHQARLRNVTDGVTTLAGTSEKSPDDGGASSTMSTIVGQFTITTAKTFEIQHQCGTTHVTNGLGTPNNFGEEEIYTIAEFWRISS